LIGVLDFTRRQEVASICLMKQKEGPLLFYLDFLAIDLSRAL